MIKRIPAREVTRNMWVYQCGQVVLVSRGSVNTHLTIRSRSGERKIIVRHDAMLSIHNV